MGRLRVGILLAGAGIATAISGTLLTSGGDARSAAARVHADAFPRVAGPHEAIRVRVSLDAATTTSPLIVDAKRRRSSFGCVIARMSSVPGRRGTHTAALDPRDAEGGNIGWCPGRYRGRVHEPGGDILARFDYRVCAPGHGGVQPPRAVTFAGDTYIAFGTAPDEPMFSDRGSGRLPYFAKTGLYVRGPGTVTLRIPRAKRGSVRISGWSGPVGPNQIQRPEPGLHTHTVANATTDCETAWTPFAGGFKFKGRHCLRLRVRGPGRRRSVATFGLRRRCPV